MRFEHPTHCLAGTALVACLVLTAGRVEAKGPAPSDLQAQQAHAAGTCGSLAPGSGLRGGKGWVVSMVPGKHEFRIRGGGDVYLSAARFKGSMDFDAGRLYYIVLEHTPADAVLEWKFLGSDWAPVAKTFLYPPTN